MKLDEIEKVSRDYGAGMNFMLTGSGEKDSLRAKLRVSAEISIKITYSS